MFQIVKSKDKLSKLWYRKKENKRERGVKNKIRRLGHKDYIGGMPIAFFLVP